VAITPPTRRRYESLIDRLISNSYMEEGSECWLWMGSLNNHGYGKINRRLKRGPRKGRVVTEQAHRVAYVAFMGVRRLTPKSVIRHSCDARSCINPAHLIKGSQKQNVNDCVQRGRHRNGSSPDEEIY